MYEDDRDYFEKFALDAEKEFDWEDSYGEDFDDNKDEETFGIDDEYIPDAGDEDPDDDLRFED